jgi:hypothetical protein
MEPTSTVLIMLDRETGSRGQVAREFLLERRPEQRGHVPAIEPAVLPANGDVSGVRANQGLSHSGIRLDEGDREGPGAERHDLASIEQIADKYKRLRPFAQRRGRALRKMPATIAAQDHRGSSWRLRTGKSWSSAGRSPLGRISKWAAQTILAGSHVGLY